MDKFNPKIHHRKSIRLQGYDYSQAGLYFITICCQNRACLFGKIDGGEMVLNDAGKHAQQCWLEIPKHFPNTTLHEYITMPNHIHGIIEIVGANHYSPNGTRTRANDYSPLRGTTKTIGSVVRGYKIGVTKWFRENNQNQFPIGTSVWQRNYWEHIVRNENEYKHIAQYIVDNPQKWDMDKLNGGDGNKVMEPQTQYTVGANNDSPNNDSPNNDSPNNDSPPNVCPKNEAWMI